MSWERLYPVSGKQHAAADARRSSRRSSPTTAAPAATSPRPRASFGPLLTVNATNSLIEKICPSAELRDRVLGHRQRHRSAPIRCSDRSPNNGGARRARTRCCRAARRSTRAAIRSGSTTDQRGAGFPRTVGAGTDMGAYESRIAVTAPPLAAARSPRGDNDRRREHRDRCDGGNAGRPGRARRGLHPRRPPARARRGDRDPGSGARRGAVRGHLGLHAADRSAGQGARTAARARRS